MDPDPGARGHDSNRTPALPAAPVSAADDPQEAIAEIAVLSGRPDTVTGGDALIRVTLTEQVDLSDVSVIAGGTDQTSALQPDDDAGTLTGVVSGLPLGDSEIEVVDTDSDASALLRVTNYPQEGPVFSGPHETPFICETEKAVQPIIGGSLGAPLDENCSIEDRVDYFYQKTSTSYAPWPEGATEYPADIRYIPSASGESEPMVVRMETGTVNRAIFRTTVRHDPLSEEEPTPALQPKNWNGAAMFMFGVDAPAELTVRELPPAASRRTSPWSRDSP